jgi:hypothetical protein
MSLPVNHKNRITGICNYRDKELDTGTAGQNSCHALSK